MTRAWVAVNYKYPPHPGLTWGDRIAGCVAIAILLAALWVLCWYQGRCQDQYDRETRGEGQ